MPTSPLLVYNECSSRYCKFPFRSLVGTSTLVPLSLFYIWNSIYFRSYFGHVSYSYTTAQKSSVAAAFRRPLLIYLWRRSSHQTLLLILFHYLVSVLYFASGHPPETPSLQALLLSGIHVCCVGLSPTHELVLKSIQG